VSPSTPNAYPASCPTPSASGSSWPGPSSAGPDPHARRTRAGLDTEEITWLADLIRSAGTTVLLVEHHMDLVMSVCDEVLVLDFGKPIAFGPPSEIRTDPKVTEAYLGATA
jgi:ABC-type transporter Mla maintaining outer membrane lipid asymmetry ATPase subunit MlaF